MGLQPLDCCDCGFEYRQGHGSLSHVIAVCYMVEVDATSRSLVQRSPTKCGVPECDSEAPIMRRPRPTRGFGETGEKNHCRFKCLSFKQFCCPVKYFERISICTIIIVRCRCKSSHKQAISQNLCVSEIYGTYYCKKEMLISCVA